MKLWKGWSVWQKILFLIKINKNLKMLKISLQLLELYPKRMNYVSYYLISSPFPIPSEVSSISFTHQWIFPLLLNFNFVINFFIHSNTLVMFSYLATIEELSLSMDTSFFNYMVLWTQKKFAVVGLCAMHKFYLPRCKGGGYTCADFTCWRTSSCSSELLPHSMF